MQAGGDSKHSCIMTVYPPPCSVHHVELEVCMCMQTSVPCQQFNRTCRVARLIEEGVENSDAVNIKQQNSPVTMSPARAGSGNGEGPRETAGRSNLPAQAKRQDTRKKKSVEIEEQRKTLAWQIQTQQRKPRQQSGARRVGCMHISHTTMGGGDKPRRVGENS